MKPKFACLFIGMVVLFLGSRMLAQQAAEKQAAAQKAQITEKLKEIVSIREQILKNHEQMVATGRLPSGDLAEIELAEARVDLALEQGDKKALVMELERLTAANRQRVEKLQGLQGDGRAFEEEVSKARLALLQAEVRLLRAKE